MQRASSEFDHGFSYVYIDSSKEIFRRDEALIFLTGTGYFYFYKNYTQVLHIVKNDPLLWNVKVIETFLNDTYFYSGICNYFIG